MYCFVQLVESFGRNFIPLQSQEQIRETFPHNLYLFRQSKIKEPLLLSIYIWVFVCLFFYFYFILFLFHL